MKKKLIDFLPSKIANLLEFKGIMNVEDIELNSIESEQIKILNENFIDTATEYGVRKKEDLYKIKADRKNESLDFRKLRLKNRKMDKMPITHKALEQKLEALFGEDNYMVEVINKDYTVRFFINTFDWNAFNEITDNFRHLIPCNMVLKASLVQKIKSNINFTSCTTIGEEVTVYPWSPKRIESKGTIKFALGSNTGVENITIYPKER